MYYIVIDRPWQEAQVMPTEYIHPFDEYAPDVQDIRYAKGVADYSNARRIKETIQQNHDKPLKVIERN